MSILALLSVAALAAAQLPATSAAAAATGSHAAPVATARALVIQRWSRDPAALVKYHDAMYARLQRVQR